MDDVSRDIMERDSPPSPTDWTAYGTRNGDEQGQRTTGAQMTKLPPAKLELLEWIKWNDTKAYDERPPTCLHYSILWKVILNNNLICKETEQDLVLAPQYY